MGKAARNRAKRAQEAAQQASREAAREAVGELVAVQTLDDYLGLLQRRPELATPEAADALREAAQAPGYGPLMGRATVLLDGARGGDPSAAWAAYRHAADATERQGEQLEPLDAERNAAREAGDHARVLELIEQSLPIAVEIGYGFTVCELLQQRGLALSNLRTANRADEIDQAIEAFRAALDVAVSGEQAASILMHLGLAFGERVHGDHADNIDDAIGVLRTALLELDGSDNEELRAMVLTNLSVALGRGERGEPAAVAREAADRCREALRFRSLKRSADDWAYSQLNLGEALRTLAELGEGDIDDAHAEFDAVIRHAGEISDASLVGTAHHALGRLEIAAAQRRPQDYVEAHEHGGLETLPDETPHLLAAREHLRTARELITGDPIRHARVLDNLSAALASLDEGDEAIEVAREALTVLRPTTAPDACREVAWRLGHLLSERGDWQGAAAAMREAVEAAELAFHARMDTVSREREVRSTGNLHRWAAYAVARDGDPIGAAVALDGGRGREIRRRLAGDTELAGVPDGLRDEYRLAVHTLAASPISGESTGASRRLQEVIAAIRRLPGRDGFGAGPQWEDLVPAVEAGWPLAYVDPTPSGTLLLCLWREDGGVLAESTFLEATSTEVLLRLVAGDAAALDDPLDGGPFHSYLFGITTEVEPGDFQATLDQFLPWLGEAVARPLHDALVTRGATGSTLVVCGPLGLAPMHAASWWENGEQRCLADALDIRYAPSGVVCAAAHRRAARRRAPHLVALADPHGNLPAAGPEVEEVAALFGAAHTNVAAGRLADISFLRRHARRASHLHLACHARGGLFDATDAAIELASCDIPASELTTVAQLDARLVVASACQSALSEISGLPDEVVSIATAMLASGSACAIASLWPVDDLATALLMTRLYHEMLVEGHRPPEALRQAQLWLRELGEDEEQRFLARHPALAAEFQRRLRTGAGAPGRRRRGDRAIQNAGAGAGERPYAHADYWAPFIAVGV